jgi:hypothetical protein
MDGLISMAKVSVAVETFLGHGEGADPMLREAVTLEALRCVYVCLYVHTHKRMHGHVHGTLAH